MGAFLLVLPLPVDDIARALPQIRVQVVEVFSKTMVFILGEGVKSELQGCCHCESHALKRKKMELWSCRGLPETGRAGR